MDTYYQALGQTEEEFKKEIEDYCKNIVKEKMFVRAVAEAEGIEYNDKAAAEYAAISGYESVETFEEDLKESGEDLNYMVLSYLVQNFVCENVVIVSDEETTAGEDEIEEDSTPEETTEEETTESETPEGDTTNDAPAD